MTVEATRILEEALALTEEERAVLADALAESTVADHADLSAEWKTEITRRIEAVEQGSARLVPGDEVDARIKKILGQS